MIDLSGLISTILGFGTSTAKDKLQRHELVIKLLKKLNLDPDHPPADFTAVYQYALVEYGIGKPKPVLEIFRQSEIQQIFRRALDQNNAAILLQEGEKFLAGHVLGDELQALGMSARREFYEFAAVFIEIAKRTRTPAEVLTNQRLESLHRQIGTMQERLNRLPTLEGIRTEMARLAEQDLLALPASEAYTAQCRAFALAQQMRGWFETLGYRFEKYEVWQDDYFEWMLNVPVRRNRFDRILVRGIEGEAGLGDVMALRQAVETQKADEGWLVTARRISRAARDEVEKPENRHLDCYTFDELVDLDADFSGYIEWLEAEIQQRGIETKYVPIACTKEELDPVTKQRLTASRYDDRDGWIDGYIDRWLDDSAKEHISVLGEFGTGKTWFAFHYAWVALKRYQEAKERGTQRPRLPLVITLRDYAKALNVENVLAGFFFTQHNIRLNSEVFDQLNQMGKLLLIFDGFDEMAAKVDKQQMINNFWELAKVVVPGAKVILTCRTEHFPEAQDGRALLNAELQASTANLTGETPQFEVLELEKFTDDQIRQVLSFQATPATVEQVMGNPQLLDLARRPVMTELILEALPDIEAGKPVDMSRVYLYAVRRKMERDIKAERTFTSLADKLYFLCELSWEMLSTDQMSLNYRLFPDRIRKLFGAMVQEEKDLDHWHYDMMGQTMLIRNADGDYAPAHRSLLEFFVAYKFAAELGALAPDFLELAQIRSCLNTSAKPQNYTWSDYFQRELDEMGQSRAISPLKEFVSEDLDRLRLSFGKTPLTKAVTDLLLPIIQDEVRCSRLLENIYRTRNKNIDQVRYVGGNAASLSVKSDYSALERKDLSHTIILGADLSYASLRSANFADANLAESIFPQLFGSVFTVAFSPNGTIFASGDAKCEISLWDVKEGKQISCLRGHTDWIRSVVFSPDGTTLASSSVDQTIRLWDVQTGECLYVLRGHTGRVRSLAFSSHNNVLVSAGGHNDQTIRFWDLLTRECSRAFLGNVYALSISLDGKTLAAGSDDHTIKIWNTDTGECEKVLHGHSNTVTGLSLSADGLTLASSGQDKTIRLWNFQTGQFIRALEEHTDWVRSLAFSPDLRTFASCSYDKTIKLWNIDSGECIRTLRGHSNWVRSIAFSPDGSTLISGSDDQTIKQWNVGTGQCVRTWEGSTKAIRNLAISEDGEILVSGTESHVVKLWNTKTGEYYRALRGHNSRVNSVAISSGIIASSSYDKTVKLWDAVTGNYITTFSGYTTGVDAITISSNGKILASGSADRLIRVWDTQEKICLKTLKGHTDWIWAVAISSDDTTLISGSYDKTIRLWNIKTGECLKTLEGHTGFVNSVAVSPNNQIIASGSNDTTIRLWNPETGKCLTKLQGHTDVVSSVSFSPNGNLLASSSNDATIKIWDIHTGECLKTLRGYTGWVSSAIFDVLGEILYSGSWDETIKVWELNQGRCIQTLSARPYEGMNITGVKGLTEVEKVTLKALGAVEDEQ